LRILLVRLRQIGDVVFTTPAIHALRRRFPDAQLSYIVEPAAAPVVLHNPHLNDVIVAPRVPGLRGMLADVALGRRLKAARYDIAIDFHGGPRASLLTWLSGAPVRIGYEIAGRGWMYTRRIARPRELRRRHSVENQWDLLDSLDIAPPTRSIDPVEMPADGTTIAAVEARSRCGVHPNDQIVVVHVSAGNPFRRWPPEHFVALMWLAGDTRARRHVRTLEDTASRVIADARSALAWTRQSASFRVATFRWPTPRSSIVPPSMAATAAPAHRGPARCPHRRLKITTLPNVSAQRPPPLHNIGRRGVPCRPCDQRACAPGDFRCPARIQPEQVLEPAFVCFIDRARYKTGGRTPQVPS
jgi:hypothetical protein